MLFSRPAAGLVSLAILLTALTACANSPNSKNLEQILAADPKLRENPITFGASGESQPQLQPKAQLPPDFPQEIPLYPNAQFQEVVQTNPSSDRVDDSEQASESQQTLWVTSDPSNFVQSFYQKAFVANNWEILSQSPTEATSGAIAARKNDLQVTVSIQPSSTSIPANATPVPSSSVTSQNQAAATQFRIQYTRNSTQIAPTTTEPQATTPQPGEPGFIGPAFPPTSTQLTPIPETNSQPAATENQVFTDLNKVAPELRQYITDLAALGVLPLEPTASKSNSSGTTIQFNPSQTISRREFARWLFAANNQLNANRPSQQIRQASSTTQPAFQDVPRTDPDFPIIQGLAEAGLIPSPLSGDATAVLFRPDAPITREQLVLWKVPLDTRQGLPNASVDAVKQTWGFQDAPRIEPRALRAVLADFQNGEQSNIRRVFGYTTLFQPKKPVTRAEAAAALWYFGSAGEGISAQEALKIKNQPSQPSATPEPTPSSSANQVPQPQ